MSKQSLNISPNFMFSSPSIRNFKEAANKYQQGMLNNSGLIYNMNILKNKTSNSKSVYVGTDVHFAYNLFKSGFTVVCDDIDADLFDRIASCKGCTLHKGIPNATSNTFIYVDDVSMLQEVIDTYSIKKNNVVCINSKKLDSVIYRNIASQYVIQTTGNATCIYL